MSTRLRLGPLNLYNLTGVDRVEYRVVIITNNQVLHLSTLDLVDPAVGEQHYHSFTHQ